MKKILAISILAALSISIFNGCETDSAESDIRINPSAATVRTGQSITFTAEGGYDYKWSLSNNSIGYLSGSRGAVVVYTATGGGSNEQQTLTLTSTIDGYPSGSGSVVSNGASYSKTTTAIITHI